MSLVRLKEKYQITVPLAIRKQLHINVGDYFDMQIEENMLILKPKEISIQDKKTVILREGEKV